MLQWKAQTGQAGNNTHVIDFICIVGCCVIARVQSEIRKNIKFLIEIDSVASCSCVFSSNVERIAVSNIFVFCGSVCLLRGLNKQNGNASIAFSIEQSLKTRDGDE